MYKTRKFSLYCVVGLCLALALSGCGAATPAATIAPTAQSQATATLAPSTSTPASTATPPPPTATATLAPPTSTPTPAATATPTAIPTDPPTPTPTVPPTPEFVRIRIGDLAAHMDADVTVIGKVVATSSFAQGFRFTLDDGSGQVTLLMWHNAYDDCYAAPQLNIGAEVRATGKVGEYQGEMQVVPRFGSQVRVQAAGGAFAPQIALNALSNYLGQVVQVTGEIGNVSGNNQGATLSIFDETGAAPIFIWRTTLDRIPKANPALGTVGTRVRVVGLVREYRGRLEIVPTLPYDVEVLSP